MAHAQAALGGWIRCSAWNGLMKDAKRIASTTIRD